MNRTALVTGASRGIGRGIALSLAGRGFDVMINYASSPEKAEETRQACLEAAGSNGHTIRAEVIRANVGNGDDRLALINFCREKFSHLDLLVNNAGITSIGRADILDATEENFDRLMAVNLKGPYFLSQLAARWMLETQSASSPSCRGQIINISSISAYAVSTNRGDYCMAKAALRMMTQLYAVRLADEGIRVYEICPGVIESDMTAPVKAKYDKLIEDGLWPIRRWGQPSDIGSAVCAIAEGAFPFSTGEVINVDGGFHMRTL